MKLAWIRANWRRELEENEDLSADYLTEREQYLCL